MKDFLKEFEQSFTKEMVNDTLKYQRDYGFNIGENNLAHNNEADAFRHAYMQAIFSTSFNNTLAKIAGDRHERQGNKRGQDPRESNMDLWNNEQGRQIASEIGKEEPLFRFYPEDLRKEIIAQKVVQKMQEGQLITGLDDTREYKEQTNLFGYKNPLTGNSRIYTREDVGEMSLDEYANNENEIMAQLEAMKGKMPTNYDLEQEAFTGGDVVYVNSYTRSDGTEVKGHYRSR